MCATYVFSITEQGFFRALFTSGFSETSHPYEINVELDDVNITRAAFECVVICSCSGLLYSICLGYVSHVYMEEVLLSISIQL